MKSKIVLLVVLVFVGMALAVGVFAGGFVAGRAMSPASTNPTALPPLTSDPNQELFAPFWQAWDIVHTYYVTKTLDNDVLMQGAIKGMLDALGDEYSAYMDPFQFKDATSQLSGSYEGIGAWVGVDGKYLTISEPMPGSPAEKAGLKPGDQVIGIDGQDMTGIAPELARRKVLGPKDSQVTLTILREGEAGPFDVQITRALINVPSVEGEMLDGNVAYVHLSIFGGSTADELRQVLTELMAQNPVGLVLDLRNNGGGEVTAAIQVASEFIGQGVLLYEDYGNDQRVERSAQSGGLATSIPMVVLINKYTASASEMVA
jgi:carboxyl-terminal processing protease